MAGSKCFHLATYFALTRRRQQRHDHVKLPRTKAHENGFPVASYHVTVTPSQPCSVHVVNQNQLGFDVVMTSLGDNTPLTEGTFSVMVVG